MVSTVEKRCIHSTGACARPVLSGGQVFMHVVALLDDGVNMKLFISGLWRRVFPKVNVAGAWRQVTEGHVKVAGQWKRWLGTPPVGNIYNGVITVGHGTSDGLELYGYHAAASGGGASPSTTKQGGGMYILTESKPFVGAPPYQWIEMNITGDITGLSFMNCSINGNIGELVSWEYNAAQGSSYIRWQFANNLNLTGTWNLIV